MKKHSEIKPIGSYAPPTNVSQPPPPVRCNALLGDPMTCPFCDAKPEFYDGVWRVKHAVDCYLFDYSEFEWIIGRKGISKWNTRTPNPTENRAAHLVRGTVPPVVLPLNSDDQSERK